MKKEQAKEIFLALDGRTGAERNAFLRKACGADEELRRLVEEVESLDVMADRAIRRTIAAEAEPAGPRQRIGPYRVLRGIGQGGMGTVYLAVRDDAQYEKQVAIKVARAVFATGESEGRFRHERQILAHLEHPNIARLLEGGATADGEPYIVMEYVEGEPISRYVKTNALRQREILPLFLKAAAAVDYAHRHLVVHRDLKPSNILVTSEGEPKLLDFGIAKMLREGGETAHTQTPIHTPGYSSPEQLAGKPETVSADVYSLGVILSEMLPEERRLDRDLRSIVSRAREADPRLRYAAVRDLAADIERYLAGQPVQARPSTALYRMRKFLLRHKQGVAVVTLLLCSVAAGWWSTARESRRTQHRLMQLRQLANSLIFDLHDRIRDLPGSMDARVHLVETAQTYMTSMEEGAGSDAALLGQIAAGYERLADLQGGIEMASAGRVGPAVGSYRKALSLLERTPRTTGVLRKLAMLRIKTANALVHHGESNEALELLRQAAQAGHEAWNTDGATGDDASVLMEAEYRLGDWLVRKGRAVEALPHATSGWAVSVEFIRRSPGPASRKAHWIALRRLGEVNLHCGRLSEARRQFAAAASVLRQDGTDGGREGMLLDFVQGNVAGNPFYIHEGDLEAAEGHYRRALAWARLQYQRDPNNSITRSDYAVATVKLANVLGELRPSGAIPLYQEVLSIRARQRSIAPESVEAIRVEAYDLASSSLAFLRTGDAPQAEWRLRRAIALDEEMVRRDPVRVECCSDIPLYASLLGDALAAQRRHREAGEAYMRAHQVASHYGARDTCGIFCTRDWALSFDRLARWHRAGGNRARAREFASHGAEVWRRWISRFGSNVFIEKKLAELGSLSN